MDLTLTERCTDRMALTVILDPADACFREHFPQAPVTPGSLIMGLCLQALADYGAGAGSPRITRFVFSRFAPPGTYVLRLQREGNAFACALSQGEHVFARGRIET